MRTVNNEIVTALEAPGTSPWLRQALHSALQRDPVAAANDAAELARLLTGKVEAILFLEEWQPPVAEPAARTTLSGSSQGAARR